MVLARLLLQQQVVQYRYQFYFSRPSAYLWVDSVFAKVIATNIVNSSVESPSGNGGVILTNPDAPINLANDATITDATRIGLTWQPGAANGGTTVIDYRLSWDQGTFNNVVLASGITTTFYITT